MTTPSQQRQILEKRRQRMQERVNAAQSSSAGGSTSGAAVQPEETTQPEPITETVEPKTTRGWVNTFGQRQYERNLGQRSIGLAEQEAISTQQRKESKVIRHKTFVAGSPENYNKYLSIVRNNSGALVASHAMAGPLNLDLAMASKDIDPLYGASEREEILIKQLHSWKGSPESKGDVSRMWLTAIPENPFVQIAGAEAMGVGLGKVSTSVAGRLFIAYGPRAVQAFNIAQVGVGGVLLAPGAIDIGSDVIKGDFKKAFPKGVMFGFTLAGGIEGYKIGASEMISFGKYKGLTPYEKNIAKGLPKSTRYNQLKKDAFADLMVMKQELRNNPLKFIQEETTFTNVEALKGKENIIPLMKQQLISTKSEGYGGAFTEKPSTHDVDIAFKSAKEPVVLKYMSKELDVGPSKSFADIHELMSPGKQVGPFGAIKEPSIKLPSNIKEMAYREQFFRLSESSIELAHKNRAKDIPESIRMLDLMVSKSGGLSKELEPKIIKFKETWAKLEANPQIMKASESKLLYESGLGKHWWEIRQKFYEKTLSDKYLNKKLEQYSSNDTQKMSISNKKLSDGSSRIPPSSSISLTPSPSSGGMVVSGLISTPKKSKSYTSNTFSSIFSKYKYNKKKIIKPEKTSKTPPPYKSPPYKSPPYKSPSSSPYYPYETPSTPSSSPPSYPSSPPSSPPSYPPSYPLGPSPKLHGKGARGSSGQWNQKKYLFRKAKIGLPFDIKTNKKLLKVKL